MANTSASNPVPPAMPIAPVPAQTPISPSSRNNNSFLIGIVAILVFVLGAISSVYLPQYFSRKPIAPSAPTPTRSAAQAKATPTIPPPKPWKTYSNETISFQYPQHLAARPILIRGSGYTLDFADAPTASTAALSVRADGNTNPVTGTPYQTLEEYLKLPYETKIATVSGQTGMQPFPQAGSEHINSVVFFSPDSAFLYTIELTSLLSDAEGTEQGKKTFERILSTFQFVGKESLAGYTNQQFGFTLQYPQSYTLEEQNPNRTDLPYIFMGVVKSKVFQEYSLSINASFHMQLFPNLHSQSACAISSRSREPMKRSLDASGLKIFFDDLYYSAATGPHATTKEYRVFHQPSGRCFQMELRHVAVGDWNDPEANQIALSDRDRAMSELEKSLQL